MNTINSEPPPTRPTHSDASFLNPINPVLLPDRHRRRMIILRRINHLNILFSRRFPLLSLLKSPSLQFLPKPRPLPRPLSSMAANRPSAFDALMSNARKAASKTTTTKRKSPDPQPVPQNPPPQNPNPNSLSPIPAESKKPRANTSVDVDLEAKTLQLKKKPNDFSPDTASWWPHGGETPFLFVASALDLISIEPGRIAITDIVCNDFSPDTASW